MSRPNRATSTRESVVRSAKVRSPRNARDSPLSRSSFYYSLTIFKINSSKSHNICSMYLDTDHMTIFIRTSFGINLSLGGVVSPSELPRHTYDFQS